MLKSHSFFYNTQFIQFMLTEQFKMNFIITHILLLCKFAASLGSVSRPIISVSHFGSNTWENVSRLFPETSHAIYHPGNGSSSDIGCKAAYPINWNLTGYFSHRRQIKFDHVKRDLVNGTFTINLYLHFNKYVKLENIMFSFSAKCQSIETPEINTEALVFIKGNANTTLISTNLPNSSPNEINCITSDPETPVTLSLLTNDGGILPIFDEIEHYPLTGFRRNATFSGTYICRQRNFSTILTKDHHIQRTDSFTIIPASENIKLRVGEAVNLSCESLNHTSVVLRPETHGEFQSYINGHQIRITYPNISSKIYSNKYACLALTDNKMSLVHHWTVEFVQPMIMLTDNFASQLNCFTSGLPRSLKTVRCRNSNHCEFMSECLIEGAPGCSSDNQLVYSSNTPDTCRHWKVKNISDCVALAYSHRAGLARCKAGETFKDWNIFLSLNSLKYTDWTEASPDELVRIDEIPQVLYTNNVTEFFCQAIAYLFADSVYFELEVVNGNRTTFFVTNENATMETPTGKHPKSIQGFNFVRVLKIKLPLNAVAIHCIAPWSNSTEVMKATRKFVTKELTVPKFVNGSESDGRAVFYEGEKEKRLVCAAAGEPQPQFTWSFNNKPLSDVFPELRTSSNSNGEGHLEFPSSVKFKISSKYAGVYTCIASNSMGSIQRVINLKIEEMPLNRTPYVISAVVSALVVCTVVPVICVLWKRYRMALEHIRDLTDDEVQEFFEGKPELLVDADCKTAEHVQFMPYDKNLEIQPDDLQYDLSPDNLLGSGNFAYVVRGRIASQGINAAIKISKGNTDVSLFKSFLSEIKIMIFLGRHENLVTLFGVCTTGIKSQTIQIATEICKLGSLNNYLRSSKDTFVNYLNENKQLDRNNSSNFAISENYILSTLDLISFSAQIAKGMLYLAEKFVIHGDLAARNILLTAEKVAKISDFGLSKQLYQDINYVKRTKTPLPWRWMAIESLNTLTFSVKSDVWSYGATLFEIFSLGGIPFPNEEWSTNFVEKLSSGMRMGRPEYCSPDIYSVMVSCWELKPDHRPHFSVLYEYFNKIHQTLLEDFQTNGENNVLVKHINALPTPQKTTNGEPFLDRSQFNSYINI